MTSVTPKDSLEILGRTFDILVLASFEELTPNLMCRTIETISGGGVIIFIFPQHDNIAELEQYHMSAHDRYKTYQYPVIHPLFMGRFLRSLQNCNCCLFLS